MQVINEVKRLCPIVPVAFGKAKEPMSFDGVTVPAGWMLLFALMPSHGTHGVYTNPERFDPDRFSPERAEDKRHQHAFVPQGAGAPTGHRCPGFDLATFMMAVFAATLLRGYTWELPPQNFELDWSKTPPEMKDSARGEGTFLPVSPLGCGRSLCALCGEWSLPSYRTDHSPQSPQRSQRTCRESHRTLVAALLLWTINLRVLRAP